MRDCQSYTESVMYEYGVFIGRFQPFHNVHLEIVRYALGQVKQLIIGIGSCNQSPDTRNPWSGEERAEMISSCFSPEERCRIKFVFLQDYFYNDLRWIADVQREITKNVCGSKDVKLIGHKKDSSSFYLGLFPQWGPHIDPGFISSTSATEVRNLIFTNDMNGVTSLVPKQVHDIISEWTKTPEFIQLRDEYEYITKERAKLNSAAHPPHFVTVDAVCICSGHVLVVKRGGKYGRNKIALPGGYLNVDETLEKSCIRELKEETSIRIPKHELKKMIVDRDVFDYPQRDQRGRVITHAFCFKIPNGTLPDVKGSDDADKAWWMNINDINTHKVRFFSDHWHIINRFVSSHKF